MNGKQVLGLIIFINGQTLFLLVAIRDMNVFFVFLTAAINVLGITLMFLGSDEAE